MPDSRGHAERRRHGQQRGGSQRARGRAGSSTRGRAEDPSDRLGGDLRASAAAAATINGPVSFWARCTSSACIRRQHRWPTSTILIALIERAALEGGEGPRPRGCSTAATCPARSALPFIDRPEVVLARMSQDGRDYKIASGGGRMVATMDRYEADWKIVERGWDAHVRAVGRRFTTAREAVETLYKETGLDDQNLPAFVIADAFGPVGPDPRRGGGDPVQLPRRPGARADARSKRSTSTSSPRAEAAGRVRRDDAVRRRPGSCRRASWSRRRRSAGRWASCWPAPGRRSWRSARRTSSAT